MTERTHLERAEDLFRKGEVEEAVRCLDEAIRIQPGDAQVRHARACLWIHLEELEKALSDCDEAVRLDPALACAFRERGTIRLRQGDLEEAIADYTVAIRLDPRDPHALRFRARVWQREGEPGKAIEDCTEALRLDPKDAGTYHQRAIARREVGEAEAAIVDLDDALRIDPRLAEAYKIRSALWQELGESSKAQEDLRRGYELDASSEGARMAKKTLISSLLQEHFGSTEDLTITERTFPFRMRADLQCALDRIFEGTRILHFAGVLQRYGHDEVSFAKLLAPNPHDPAVSVPLEYEELDIGETTPLRCLKNGLWLLEEEGARLAMLLAPESHGSWITSLRVQVAARNDPDGTRVRQAILKRLEEAVLRSESYRGKILSLEAGPHFSGISKGILVHRLRTVSRDDVILPRKTLDLLDRNVMGFVRQRKALARFGLPTRKGLLFYGPPGTGKTHTIHYLAGALEGHTTLLVTAEQMGLLAEYMMLARLLQPSVVVIEDVDLIARDRAEIEGCGPVLLHELLNEMDGLRQDADVLFILTTNRPETLERALASRPGRVDQAIEFPLPDEEGRDKLVRLYSCGLSVPDDVIRETVKRTDGVSASFIKELMRRSAQFHLEREDSPAITREDVAGALDEMLFAGGTLNRRLLGAAVEEAER